MAKQPKKKAAAKPKAKPDFAQNAFRVVQEATGAAPKTYGSRLKHWRIAKVVQPEESTNQKE